MNYDEEVQKKSLKKSEKPEKKKQWEKTKIQMLKDVKIELNTRIIKNEDGGVIQEAVGENELCVFQEFLLRYFNQIKKNNNKWFLIPEMAEYLKL